MVLSNPIPIRSNFPIEKFIDGDTLWMRCIHLLIYHVLQGMASTSGNMSKMSQHLHYDNSKRDVYKIII
uniref:Uncharacterized protein n=1 Tax=Rhizophora mucronata TaxID=61149 RepID=A0A2P2PDQ2_RHIMU